MRKPARNVKVYVGRPTHQSAPTLSTGSIQRGTWDLDKYDEQHPQPATQVTFGFQRSAR